MAINCLFMGVLGILRWRAMTEERSEPLNEALKYIVDRLGVYGPVGVCKYGGLSSAVCWEYFIERAIE